LMTAVKMLWGPATIGPVQTPISALTAASLNDADNAAGWIFNVPKDGTIADVGVLVVTENGTSPAYNAGIVTLDTSGRPTTSAYGGSAVTPATWTTAGFKWVTLSTPATGAAGDFAAVHIYPTGTAPTGVNFITVPSAGCTQGIGVNVNFTASWAAVGTGSAGFAIRYNDGSVYGLALSSSTVHLIVRSNTTPDEVGNLFTVPTSMVCTGARMFHATAGLGASATTDIVLYDASGGVLASATVSDRDYIKDVSLIDVSWDAVNLTPGVNYRLIIKPTTSVNGDIYATKWTFDSAAALAAVPEGARWQYTSRTDAGAWTDDNVSVCPMGLWISDITFIAGSGSGGTEWGFVG
jgi:hypothetical protein